jgi:Arc/MetJ-type ribon-helix-helix transcriptional regulator
MPTFKVLLTDHQVVLIERLVISERYQSIDEVLSEGLRLIESAEAQAAARLEALGNTSPETGPVDPSVEQAWLEEVQRRSRELDEGIVKTIPADEVFDRLRKERRR